MVFMEGFSVKVPPVAVNIEVKALELVLPVPVVGIRYATVYSPV